MAVIRVQSLKVNNIKSHIKHRLNPPAHENLVLHRWKAESWAVYETIRDMQRLREFCDVELFSEFFKVVESKNYTQKIRKNAAVQEIVIAYSDEDVRNMSDPVRAIEEDVELFLKAFKEKYHFRPNHAVFVHRGGNRYHVHILFSLMKPDLSKKVRWSKKDYFEIAQKVARESRFVKVEQSGGVGSYPLWLVREFERLVGVKESRKVVRKARKEKRELGFLLKLLKKAKENKQAIDEFLSEKREKSLKERWSECKSVNKDERALEKAEALETIKRLFSAKSRKQQP